MAHIVYAPVCVCVHGMVFMLFRMKYSIREALRTSVHGSGGLSDVISGMTLHQHDDGGRWRVNLMLVAEIGS